MMHRINPRKMPSGICDVDEELLRVYNLPPVPRPKRDVKLSVVIPVHGRESLFSGTIRQVKAQTLPLHDIIVVGDTESEKAVADEEDVTFFRYKNSPLGDKWQSGIDYARERGATDLLFLGSSDWLAHDWCEVMVPELFDGYDLIGRRDIFFVDVGVSGNRVIHWFGYDKDSWYRRNEPIGAGRIISQEILDKLDWQLLDKTRESSMDWVMYCRIIEKGGRIRLVGPDKSCFCSISHHKWSNKHSFESECANPLSVQLRDPNKFITDKFPGLLEGV